MINIGAKTSAGNNFNSKAAPPAAALAHTDGPRIEQKKLATSSVSLVSVTDPEVSTFEP